MSENNRYTGRVKWFNNKSGFGFITLCDGDNNEKDIFVHWSSIKVENSQYKYLVQGEYVDFNLVKPDRGEHEFHAVDISGVKGGRLMCETRREHRDNTRPLVSRQPHSSSQRQSSSDDRRGPRHTRRPPRDSSEHNGTPRDNEGYTTVSKRRPQGKGDQRTRREPQNRTNSN